MAAKGVECEPEQYGCPRDPLSPVQQAGGPAQHSRTERVAFPSSPAFMKGLVLDQGWNHFQAHASQKHRGAVLRN